MEDAPLGSGKAYKFIPARRNDTVRKTGHPKYLPIISENNYGTIMVNDAAMRRSKRDVFTNVGAIYSLANIGDIDISEYIERKKRVGSQIDY